MTLYEEYKPFRNYIRQFDLLSSLVDVWRYSLHVMENQPLPADYAVGLNQLIHGQLKRHVWSWDLDILSREILLNAGSSGKRFTQWINLATAINHIRRLDELIGSGRAGNRLDVMFELHRIAHRQFPWQTNKGMGPMVRALKVFGAKGVDEIVVRELGMTARQFILLGIAVSGHFLEAWGMSTNHDYSVIGISQEATRTFFERIVNPIQQIRTEIAKRQSYDQDWLYTWNPLEATPLVAIDRTFPDRVICPIPRYLLHRTSGGLFYDLVRSADFDNPFGTSFQTYIGEIIDTTCRPPRFELLAEQAYNVGSNKMHGIDWILSDDSAHLFIECKTKRLTVSAKTVSDGAALDKDLIVLATAVVQTYRNARDAVEGKTRWIPDEHPVYPLILTLEDWFIFSPRIHEMLGNHVRRLLSEMSIPEDVLVKMPYTIASAHEFEITSQVIAQAGIDSVMAKKVGPSQRWWSLLPFAREHFKSEMQNVDWHLFSEDWLTLLPEN